MQRWKGRFEADIWQLKVFCVRLERQNQFFGPILSLFFVDPDGLEGEVCVTNPDSVPGVVNPPGTPAARYSA